MKELKMDEMMNLNGGQWVQTEYKQKYKTTDGYSHAFAYDSSDKSVKVSVWDGEGTLVFEDYEFCKKVADGKCYI